MIAEINSKMNATDNSNPQLEKDCIHGRIDVTETEKKMWMSY